jgi:hypothetical protein
VQVHEVGFLKLSKIQAISIANSSTKLQGTHKEVNLELHSS